MGCVLTDLEEISSRTLSKRTFFLLVCDLQATLTTNYHKNKNNAKLEKKKNVVLNLKAQLFVQVYNSLFILRPKLYNRLSVCF